MGRLSQERETGNRRRFCREPPRRIQPIHLLKGRQPFRECPASFPGSPNEPHPVFFFPCLSAKSRPRSANHNSSSRAQTYKGVTR